MDKYLPDYDFNEVHTIIIKQPVEKVYPLLKSQDFSSEKIIKALFKIRGLPVSNFTLSGLVEQMNFTWLAEQENKELLIAYWGNVKPEFIVNAETFRQDKSTYNRKIIWNFLLESLTNTSCRVTTETRIKHYTAKAKIIFSIYWFFIRPFSGLIRILMLQNLKRRAEGIKV
ncbi:hypothetical protein [Adhaeribacter arboris]|nr:hypothetical protein [Adhaeribacter arboris]